MSALLRWNQSRVAAVPAFGRRRRLRRVAREPPRDVEVVELLGPDHAGERLALHQPRVGVGDALLAARRRTRRPRRPAARTTASKSANGSPAASAGRRRSRNVRRRRPGPSSTWWTAHFVPSPTGLTAPASPCDDEVVDAVLERARARPRPKGGGRWSRSRRTAAPRRARRTGAGGGDLGMARAGRRRRPPAARAARAAPRPRVQDQVLRNQSCGSRCSGAASGPRFSTVTRSSRSSGAALAYSTVTSW